MGEEAGFFKGGDIEHRKRFLKFPGEKSDSFPGVITQSPSNRSPRAKNLSFANKHDSADVANGGKGARWVL